jgi:sporulation protein YlmC with PRC-barrel domain
MKKLVAVITLLSVFGFLLTVGALAQPAPGSGTTREPGMTSPSAPSTKGELYASKLIGASVKNAQGENLGRIDELVIDPSDARITTAVIAVGGVLGLGAKSVAIPWNKVTMGSGSDRDTVVVAMEKEEFEKAPTWEKTNK